MPPQVLLSRLAADSLAVALPHAISVSNWPKSVTDPRPSVWFSTILPMIATALLSFMASRWIYERQKRDAEKARLLTAYNAFSAICDEMWRSLERVWQIIEHQHKDQYMKAPIDLTARDALLARVVELMPPDWEPTSVFRFYNLMTLVAVHHNKAVAIPPVSDTSLRMASHAARDAGSPIDSQLWSDVRAGRAARDSALSFALFYLDPDDREGMTNLCIDAIGDLHRLGIRLGRDDRARLPAPSSAERERRRKIIAELMPPVTPVGPNTSPGESSPPQTP